MAPMNRPGGYARNKSRAKPYQRPVQSCHRKGQVTTRAALLLTMPKAGMIFDRNVAGKERRDALLCRVLKERLKLDVKPMPVQREFCELIDLGTRLAARIKPSPMVMSINHGLEVSEFFNLLHDHDECRIGIYIFSHLLAYLFAGLVQARERYIRYRPDQWYPKPGEPETTPPPGFYDRRSPMAKAIDRFLSVAWFWNEAGLVMSQEADGKVLSESLEEQDLELWMDLMDFMKAEEDKINAASVKENKARFAEKKAATETAEAGEQEEQALSLWFSDLSLGGDGSIDINNVGYEDDVEVSDEE